MCAHLPHAQAGRSHPILRHLVVGPGQPLPREETPPAFIAAYPDPTLLLLLFQVGVSGAAQCLWRDNPVLAVSGLSFASHPFTSHTFSHSTTWIFFCVPHTRGSRLKDEHLVRLFPRVPKETVSPSAHTIAVIPDTNPSTTSAAGSWTTTTAFAEISVAMVGRTDTITQLGPKGKGSKEVLFLGRHVSGDALFQKR